jgi:cold shock CspA family protein
MTEAATNMMRDNTNGEERGPDWVDYKALPLHKARVKFYDQEKKFGFVVILDEQDNPRVDAYLSGRALERAGIYELKENDVIYVKFVVKEKGEAVIFVKRKVTENRYPTQYQSRETGSTEFQRESA